MHPVRKKGRGGGGGKAVAPHPDELIGVSPPGEDAQKRLPGLRTRKPETSKSPLEVTTYGSSNLAVAVLSRFQRDKESMRADGKVDEGLRGVKKPEESVEETTPKVAEGGEGDKPLPEVPQKKPVRSVSRGKEPAGKLPGGKEDRQVVRSGDEKKNPRRSVSAQPIREYRQREPFDCSSKVGPISGVREAQRGVARAFLRSSTKAPVETRKSETVLTKKSVQQEETGDPYELKGNSAAVRPKEQASSTTDLHQRLASLEDRVRQLESELKGTKELLHASNPLNNQVLSEIQVKLANLEKEVFVRASCDGSSKESRMSLASLDNVDPGRRTSLSSLPTYVTEVAKSKPSLQQKLVESRAALQQKIVDNKVLLRSKIAALEGGGGGGSDGEVITEQFLASLTQSQALLEDGSCKDIEMSSFVPSKFMDVENGSSPVKKCSPVALATSSAKKRRTSEHGDADNKVFCSSGSYKSVNTSASQSVLDTFLQCEESLEGDETKENAEPEHIADYELPLDEPEPELCDIGTQAAMAGWYVYEAEGLLLANEDGSCAFYDVANMDLKSVYKSPAGLAPATWRDCWLIRAAGSDGRMSKYVVAASAGTAVDPAFCSWNFYDKTIAAYHSESLSWPTTPTSSSSGSRNDTLRSELDFPLWWYRPCGPIIASGGSGLKTVALYDIRDGDLILHWDSDRCLATLPYSSPIQWRSKDTVLLAEDEGISLWDISSDAQCVSNVDLTGKTIRALHIFNSDGECNGGVRQRNSNSDTGGLDGVFATEEAVNVLDVRTPSGLGLQLPTFGTSVHSLYASKDAIYAGLTGVNNQCVVQQWSIRKGQPEVLYTVPYSAASHYLQTEISQVWGDSDYVMAVNGNGLFVYDATTSLTSFPRAVIGSDDLYCPSFDYSGSKVLLVSRDRPASWKYWPTSPSWSV